MMDIKIGITYTLEEKVTVEKSANQVGSGLLDVYSTPAMIALMERASYLSLENYLDENESTVGGEVNIRHMQPTAIGKTVVCTSKVVDIEKTKIKFEVLVKEDSKVIGKGTHTRFVIDRDAFLEML